MILAAQRAGLTVKAVETHAGTVRVVTDDEPPAADKQRPDPWRYDGSTNQGENDEATEVCYNRNAQGEAPRPIPQGQCPHHAMRRGWLTGNVGALQRDRGQRGDPD